MTCEDCKNWSGYCKICSTKPSPTGNPATCPYFGKK